MKRNKSGTGVTLLEILIIVSIIITMTSILMINHKETQKKLSLQRAAHKVAQDIRAAQEMTMSARECQPCGGVVPPGYGAFFDVSSPNQYILYADTQPSPDGDEFYFGDTDIEIINLEKGVFIKDINTSSQLVSVNFKPPDPKITIKYQQLGGEVSSVIITLALEFDSSVTKTIKINTVGLIDIGGTVNSNSNGNGNGDSSGTCNGGQVFCFGRSHDECIQCGCEWWDVFPPGCMDPGGVSPDCSPLANQSDCETCGCTWTSS